MSTFSSRLRFVLFFGGLCMVLGGLVALGIGVGTLSSAGGEADLSVSEGSDVAIPSSRGIFGGSVMVYSSTPVEDAPQRMGCELVEADGDLAQITRMGNVDHLLADPVTVDGATWYPLTEVKTVSQPATLRCPSGQFSSLAVSEASTFGRMSSAVGFFAVASGVLALVVGALAVVVAHWVLRPKGGGPR